VSVICPPLNVQGPEGVPVGSAHDMAVSTKHWPVHESAQAPPVFT
jgi:hypothetical protein